MGFTFDELNEKHGLTGYGNTKEEKKKNQNSEDKTDWSFEELNEKNGISSGGESSSDEFDFDSFVNRYNELLSKLNSDAESEVYLGADNFDLNTYSLDSFYNSWKKGLEFLEKNYGNYENGEALLEEFKGYENYYNDLVNYNNQIRDYYSQWADADEYDAYKAQEGLLDMDIGAAEQKLAQLKEQRAGIGTDYSTGVAGTVAGALDPRKKAKKPVDENADEKADLDRQITELEMQINLAKRAQNAEALYSGAIEAPDFEKYSFEPEKPEQRIIPHQQNIPRETESEKRYMTEEQRAVYNYYYNKFGEEKAEEYYDTIADSVREKKAQAIFEGNEGKVLPHLLMAAQAGLEQSKAGFQGAARMALGDDSYQPRTEFDYYSEMAKEDLADFGEMPEWIQNVFNVQSVGTLAYDFVQTGANMAPSIAIGMATGPFTAGLGGSLAIGTSAGGNTYTETLREGYSAEQARNYAVLSGASEAVLSSVLSGIGALGGKLTNKAVSKLVNVDGVLKKIAKTVPIKMGAEGLEEYLQEILDPIFRNAVLDENNEINLLSPEALYSFILGALSSGGFVAGEVALDNYNAKQTYGEFQGELVEEGIAAPEDSVAHKLAAIAKEKIESGKDLSGSELRRLADANEEVFAPEQERAQADAGVVVAKNATVDSAEAKSASAGGKGLRAYAGKEAKTARNVADIAEIAKSFEYAGKDTPGQIAALYNKRSKISAEEFSRGISEAYRYGASGISIEEMNRNGSFVRSLEDYQRTSAYYLGQNNAEKAIVAQAKEQQKKVLPGIKGKVVLEGRAAVEVFNDPKQTSVINFIDKVLAKASGIEYHVFSSFEQDGKRVYVNNKGETVNAPNGWYNPETRQIWIDLHAGSSADGKMLFTLTHEHIHDIKVWSAKHYNRLVKITAEVFGKSGKSFEEAVAVKLEQYRKNHPETDLETAREEVVAETMSGLLQDGKALAEFSEKVYKEDRSLWEKIKDWFRDVIGRITAAYKDVAPDSEEARMLLEQKELFEEAQKVFAEAVFEAGQNYRKASEQSSTSQVKNADTNAKSQAQNHDGSQRNQEKDAVKYQNREKERPKISVGMTDSERTKILRYKKIVAPVYEGQADDVINAKADKLKSSQLSVVKTAITKIGEEFGVYIDYDIKDVGIKISLSRNNLKESLQKEATPSQIAKLMPILKNVVENSVGIERHANRYYYDDATLYFDELLGGFVDGDVFVPVRFGIRHSKSSKPVLYVVIDQEGIEIKKIKAEVKNKVSSSNEEAAVPRSAFKISISQIIHSVNNKDVLRYLPDNMLDSEQRKAKWEGIAETIQKTDKKNDDKYIEFVQKGNIGSLKSMVAAAAKAHGYEIRAFHGTSRGDRVGNVFLPERATSGPMAYDPDFDSYETQFRIKVSGRDIPLYKAWGYLPFPARNRITQKAGQLRENWDGENELILDPETNEANGGFQWQLKMSGGNTIRALIEQWLNSGNLFNEERKFLDVLEMTGVTEEFKKIGLDSLYFKDPNERHEKVYDTYLKITNPFDTANADEKFVTDLLSWYEEQDESKYERENMESDMWDKNGIDAYDFADRVKRDIENNTTHAWTSIPDSVTDYLKSLGHDGIKDLGGKFHETNHTVWIPFYSNQVKSAEPITYDEKDNVIPISKRFDEEKVDIRWQDRLPIEDRNRLSVLGGKKDRLSKELAVLEKEFGDVIREAYRQNIEPDEGLSERAEKLNAKAAYRLMSEVASVFHVPKETAEEFVLPIIAEMVDKGPAISESEGLFEKLLDTAYNHTEDYIVDNDPDGTYKNLRNYIRRTPLFVDSGTKADIGDFNSFRKHNMGSLNLVNDTGALSLDEFYDEVAGIAPEYFSGSVDGAEQLYELSGFMKDRGRTESIGDFMPKEEFVSWAEETLSPEIDRFFDSAVGTFLSEASRKETERKKAAKVKNAFETVSDRITGYDDAIKEARAEGVLAGQMSQGKAMAKEMRHKAEAYEEAIAKKKEQISEVRARRDELLEKARTEKAEAVAKVRQEARDKLEKTIADVKAQKNAQIDALRERHRGKETEIKEKYRDSIKKATEGRHRTILRGKIKRVVGELNDLLLHGGKERHVPERMKAAVAKALDVLNVFDPSYYDSRIENLERKIEQEQDPAERAKLKVEHAKVLEQREKAELEFSVFKAAYDELGKDGDAAFDPVAAEKIDAVAAELEHTKFRDMSMSQLEQVYELYSMLKSVISKSNKLFAQGKAESAAEVGEKAIAEVQKAGGNHPLSLKAMKGIKSFFWNNEKPIYAFERIGSGALTDMFKSIRRGEDTWARDVAEAKDFYEKAKEKYHVKKWDGKKTFAFETSEGISFKLTVQQMMSIYAYSKRKDADKHLSIGGFVFDPKTEVKKGLLKYEVNNATAHNISPETILEIAGKLTDEQRAFVDEMQTYLSEVMGAKGNEVSMAMYDVKLFKEKNYFPLKSANQYLFEQNNPAGEIKLKNSGFTKSRVPGANNPVVLSDFIDVWANHVNDMSMYHAFVLPIEDFNRVYNYKTSLFPNQKSVKGVIQNAYGEAANKYISQLLTDLNGGARIDNAAGLMNSLISKFKKASVFASASVVIQQPSAIVRAHAVLGERYFYGFPKVEKHKVLWEEVKKYAPVAVIKEMGYFDTNMGMSTVDYIKDEKTVMDWIDDKMSWAPAYADEVTWCAIWNAVKRETKAKNPELNSKSEEFLKICGERFTEVIVRTQVYDSVLSRSANMRSRDLGMKMATAFMAEPTTSINMLEDAIRQAKRGHKKQAVKTAASVYGSILLNAALVSIVYAARDDDEDETYLEKYIGSLTAEALDGINPLTMIPFVKDVISITQGYEVDRADMSLVTKVYDAFEKVMKSALKDTSGMDEEELSEYRNELRDAVMGFAGEIGNLFGIPARNVIRDMKAAINVYETLTGAPKASFGSIFDQAQEGARKVLPVVGWFGEENKQKRLFDAIAAGDSVYAKRIKDSYSSESAYNTALRKALRENDPRIREAAQARIDGDMTKYMKLAKQVIAMGFDQDNVVAAINSEINSINKGEESSSGSGKEKGFFAAGDIKAAILDGDSADFEAVRNDLIATDMVNGKTREEAEKEFYGDVKKAVQEAFEEGDISSEKAQKLLVSHGNLSAEDAEEDVRYWQFKIENPDTYADDSWIDKYYSEIADSGIEIEVYVGYRNEAKNCSGTDKNGDGRADSGSVKAQKLLLIDALPISKAQKDAIYYSEGWAKSTIWEAPWH